MAITAWTWRYETGTGQVLQPDGVPVEPFPSQGDAESWLGESWRSLVDAGVDQVSLFEDGAQVYGPMSLHPVE